MRGWPVCDIRGGQTFDGLFEALDNLKEMQHGSIKSCL